MILMIIDKAYYQNMGLSHNLQKVHILVFLGIHKCLLKGRLFIKIAYINCLKTNLQFRDSPIIMLIINIACYLTSSHLSQGQALQMLHIYIIIFFFFLPNLFFLCFLLFLIQLQLAEIRLFHVFLLNYFLLLT